MMKFMDGALSFTRNLTDRRVDVINISIEPWHIETRSLLEFNNMHQHDLSDQKNITATLCIPDIL